MLGWFFLPETNEYKVISNGQFVRLFQNSRFYVCPCFSWSHMHTCMVRCMHLFLNNLYIGIDVAKLALACNFDYADLGSKKASERIMQRQLPQHVLTSFVWSRVNIVRVHPAIVERRPDDAFRKGNRCLQHRKHQVFACWHRHCCHADLPRSAGTVSGDSWLRSGEAMGFTGRSGSWPTPLFCHMCVCV